MKIDLVMSNLSPAAPADDRRFSWSCVVAIGQPGHIGTLLDGSFGIKRLCIIPGPDTGEVVRHRRNNRRPLQGQCVGHRPRHPRGTSGADLRAVPASRQLQYAGQGWHRPWFSPSPSRSLRCTAVASGSSRLWVRAQPSKWNSPPEEGAMRSKVDPNPKPILRCDEGR
jgi:hypothetical protein